MPINSFEDSLGLLPGHSRAAAAMAAAACTSLLFAALLWVRPPAQGPVPATVFVQALLLEASRLRASEPARLEAPLRTGVQVRGPAPAAGPIPRGIEIAPRAAESPPAPADQPAAKGPGADRPVLSSSADAPMPVAAPSQVSASAPLRLGPEVLREAERASRSAVRKMAEAAGQPLEDSAALRDRLAADTAAAAKPDCVEAGRAAGLFAPLVVLVQAAADRCRVR